MANWNEYKASEQKVTWGVGLTLDGTGRFPLIAKRIWSTLADAQAWIDDTSADSTATPGLTITVINDTVDKNNGVYFVKSIASGETAGVLQKLGESSSAESVKEQVDALTEAVGAKDKDAITKAFENDANLSGSTTIIEALKNLELALNAVDTEVEGEYVSQVTQTNGKIAVKRVALPVSGVTDDAVDNQVVTKIQLENGVVKATHAQLNDTQISATAISSSATQVAVEGENVDDQIKSLATSIKSVENLVENLDKEDSAVEGKYVSSVSEEDGVITVSREALPVSGVTDDVVDNQVVTKIQLENGVVKATHAQLSGSQIATSAIASSTTKVAIDGTDVATQLDNIATAIKSEETARKTAIENLDKEDSAVEGKYVSSVSEENGVITVSRVALPVSGVTDDTVDNQVVTKIQVENGVLKATHAQLNDTQISATAISSSATQVAVDGETVDDQIKSLATSIKSVQDTAAEYTVQKVDSTEAGVKEYYQLVKTQDGKSTGVEVKIPIYMDSSLKEVYLGMFADTVDETTGVVTKTPYSGSPESMNFVYYLNTGKYSMTQIDITKFFEDVWFGYGLASTSGVVHVHIDSAATEPFIAVTKDGVKITGVTDAIASAKTEVAEDSDFLSISSTTVDGHYKYTISTSGIASEADLNELSGKAITTVSATGITTALSANEDGTQNLALTADGSTIKVVNEITSGGTEAFIVTGKTVDEALQMIVDEIIADEKVEAEALNAIRESVGLADDASYTPSASDNYITGATTVSDALDKLDAAIKNVSDSASSVLDPLDYSDDDATGATYVYKVTEENGQITVEHKELAASAVTATAIEKSDDNGTVAVTGTTVAEQIESISKTLYDDLTIDCGTY